MKIAQIVQPWLPVPPPGYGGTERVVSQLTEGLVRRGHDVTLFASGDSRTSARLVSHYPQALGNSAVVKRNPYNSLLHLLLAFRRHHEFELIHSHSGYMGMILAELVKPKTPTVHTIHGAISPEVRDPSGTASRKRELLDILKDQFFVSISDDQRRGFPQLNYVQTVYNGIPLDPFPFQQALKDPYIVWLGRITPDKGLEAAMDVARRTGIRLELAGFIDAGDREYFQTVIKTRIDGRSIIYHGELAQRAKAELLGGARVFLFPIQWEEPFGLVMTEAMACGTPVVAFARGSVPEVVMDGVTGYIVRPEADNQMENGKWKERKWTIKKTGIAGLCEAVERIYAMPDDEYRAMRRACRKHVEDHFTVEKMVEGYEEVYRKILHI